MLSDDTEVFMASPVQSPSANNNDTRQHKALVAGRPLPSITGKIEDKDKKFKSPLFNSDPFQHWGG